MRSIKMVVDAMRGNLDEASRYLDRAEDLRESHKDIADWFVAMANQHVAFNSDGHKVAEKLVQDAKASNEDNPLTSGMMAVYEMVHADLIKKDNETKARISAYK